MYCLARSPAVSRASASSRLSRLAASCRASLSICLSSSSLASSAVRLATRSSSCCCCATSCSYFFAAAAACCSRAPTAVSPRVQVPLEPIDRGLPLDELGFASRQRLFERCDLLCRSARAWRSASVRISCAFSLASSSVSFRRVSASRSASLTRRSGLLFGAADRFGGDALAVGDPNSEHRTGRDQGDDGADQIFDNRQHA